MFFLALISSDISTTWSAILRDCADPGIFCPQRYLDDDSLPDPLEVIFGFGRRLDHRFFFIFVGSPSDTRGDVQGYVPVGISLRPVTGE